MGKLKARRSTSSAVLVGHLDLKIREQLDLGTTLCPGVFAKIDEACLSEKFSKKCCICLFLYQCTKLCTEKFTDIDCGSDKNTAMKGRIALWPHFRSISINS